MDFLSVAPRSERRDATQIKDYALSMADLLSRYANLCSLQTTAPWQLHNISPSSALFPPSCTIPYRQPI